MSSIHDFEVKDHQRFKKDRQVIDAVSPKLKGQQLYFKIISREKEYVEVGTNIFLIPMEIPVSSIPIVFIGTVHEIERTNYTFLFVQNIHKFFILYWGKLKTSITSYST